ncbi:MAG: hypothetical protein C4539_16660 [Ignavibacteriales bacterium]|nr:MAG: hypothetical protein C4539_16660 [Ignavibacteriales bacterium]
MKMRTCFIACLLSFNACLFAQQRIDNLARPSQYGIFVLVGYQIASQSLDHLKANIIERRNLSENNWIKLVEISAPASLEEFKFRLNRFSVYLPDPSAIKQIPAEMLWNKLVEYKKIDSLKAWANTLPVQLALGIAYLDTTAQKEIKYEYRISRVETDGNVKVSYLSNQISYPVKVDFNPIKAIDKQYLDNSIFIQYKSLSGKKPFAVKLFRRDGLAGNYNFIPSLKTISAKGDTIIYSLRDTLIQANQIYQYYILPADYFGSIGNSSDTILVAAYNFSSVPLPKKITVMNLTTGNGLRISWQLTDIQYIKSLRIYRSESWSDKGKLIAEVSPYDSVYSDQNIEPMKIYYYEMEMIGILNEVSPKTAKVYGLYKSTTAPLPPRIKNAVGLKNGISFEIFSDELLIKGYRVYRSNTFDTRLQPISGIVLWNEGKTIFTDSSAELSGKVFYNYAIKAENTSGVLSEFSDTISARPLKPTTPPAPLNLTAKMIGNKIFLSWADMKPFEQSINGYYIYRREISSKGKEISPRKKLTDSLITPSQLSFIDSTFEKGKIYEYSVQIKDLYDGLSDFSSSAVVEIKIKTPIAPAGILAESTPEGIRLTWDEPVNSEGYSYRIYRSKGREKEKPIATITSEPFEFLDKSVVKNERYNYYIRSITKEGTESKSSQMISILK